MTFTAETDLDSVRIVYDSTATSISNAAVESGPVTVAWTSAPHAAFVVQDASHFLWLFTAGNKDAKTVELGLTAEEPNLVVTPLTSTPTGSGPPSAPVAQMGDDFFGLSRLDGSGIPLERDVKLAAVGCAAGTSCTQALGIDASHAKTAVVASDLAQPFDSLVFVVGAEFPEPCAACSHWIRKASNRRVDNRKHHHPPRV